MTTSEANPSRGIELVGVAIGVAVVAGLEIANYGRISLSQPSVLHVVAPLLLSRLFRSELARRISLILCISFAAVVAALSFIN